ncbi:MAG: glycosyltransferase [Peptococcaceae bacterium]|nr:glycosyltransferase [Peptococcaceae bacterium]
MKKRVLIGSPVRQPPDILELFLGSLANLAHSDLETDVYFIDDNEDGCSSDLLEDFKIYSKMNVVIEKGDKSITQYIRNEKTHFWDEKLVWKVAGYKNKIIDYCRMNNYDYLFLVDSDLVLHPKTIEALIEANKDIISEVFWTKWQPDSSELPQVWLYDQYNLIRQTRGEVLGPEETDLRYLGFLNQLREPGVYEVGGLGACTLITQEALAKGVNFNEIYNITFWGEDRHFCIRAAALGFNLYVDTHYPAYHIYRLSDLPGAIEYLSRNTISDISFLRRSKERREEIYLSLIREFIKTFYSCDYRLATGYEGSGYFTPKYLNKLNQVEETNLKWLIQNQITCVSKPVESEITAKTESKIEIRISFTLSIAANGQNETLSLQGNITLLRQEQARWLVDSLQLQYPDGSEAMGFSLAELLQNKKRRNKAKNNKLTLMMLVRNEADKMLRKTLSHAAKYADEAVILDDASTDDTVAICQEIFKDKPLTIVSNEHHGFSNEIALRKQLWNLTVQTNPDWILALDADEVFEDSIIQYIRQLIDQPAFDYYTFRLYDMWDEDHYREDTFWQAHKYFRIFLTRYQPDFHYAWYETPQHCGRLPYNIFALEGCQCYIRLKHLGWSTPELREEKYKRYLELDPEGKYGNINQYQTILSPDPILKKWE